MLGKKGKECMLHNWAPQYYTACGFLPLVPRIHYMLMHACWWMFTTFYVSIEMLGKAYKIVYLLCGKYFCCSTWMWEQTNISSYAHMHRAPITAADIGGFYRKQVSLSLKCVWCCIVPAAFCVSASFLYWKSYSRRSWREWESSKFEVSFYCSCVLCSHLLLIQV